MKRLLHAIAAGLVLTLALTTPAQGAITIGTILNLPEAYSKDAYALVKQTVVMVDAMPPGSKFRHMGFLWDSPELTSALIRAHRRGVGVRVILSRGARRGEAERLAAVVGHDRSQRSFVYYPTASAFSSDIRYSVHVKLTQFSQTGKRTHVSLTGSANFALTNTLGSSNSTEVYQDTKLYHGLRKYFNAAAADKTQSGYRKIKSGGITLYTFPGAPDVVGRALRSIRSCKGVRIDVAMFQFVDSQIRKAQRLWALASKGCDVNVIWNYAPTKILIGTEVGRELLKTKDGKRIIEVKNGRLAGRIYVHNKQIAIKTPKGTAVYGGSKNWNSKRNSDLISVNRSPTVYRQYQAQFDNLWTIAVPASLPVYDPVIAAAAEEREWDSAE